MKILAIDTATEACSAALFIDGEIIADYKVAPREHSRLILKMVEKLLEKANLTIAEMDAIAFGRGPGSFMGVRIAAGVVQGIAFAHDIPVIPISTLKAIAQRAYEQTQNSNILVAIDARMGEVYWCDYYLDPDHSNQSHSSQIHSNQYQWLSDGKEQVLAPEKVTLPERLNQQGMSFVGAGTGWGAYKEQLEATTRGQLTNGQLSNDQLTIGQLSTILPECLPSAEVIVKLAVAEFSAGNMVTAAEAIPVYIRNDVARKPKPFVL